MYSTTMPLRKLRRIPYLNEFPSKSAFLCTSRLRVQKDRELSTVNRTRARDLVVPHPRPACTNLVQTHTHKHHQGQKRNRKLMASSFYVLRRTKLFYSDLSFPTMFGGAPRINRKGAKNMVAGSIVHAKSPTKLPHQAVSPFVCFGSNK